MMTRSPLRCVEFMNIFKKYQQNHEIKMNDQGILFNYLHDSFVGLPKDAVMPCMLGRCCYMQTQECHRYLVVVVKLK